MNKLILLQTERYIKATDNWHPCFPENTVKVSVSLNNYNGFYVRFAAWGNDDYGMIKDFETKSYEEAKQKYDEAKDYLLNKFPKKVNKRWFFRHGFEIF